MRNTARQLRRCNKEKEEIKNMRELTLIDTRDIEIIKEDNGTYTVEFYYEEDLLISVKNQIDVEEAIEDLKELALKHLNTEIYILSCAELMLVQAYRIDTTIALKFRDCNSRKMYEINFYCAVCNSLEDFIERNTIKLMEMLKEILKVDMVQISF